VARCWKRKGWRNDGSQLCRTWQIVKGDAALFAAGIWDVYKRPPLALLAKADLCRQVGHTKGYETVPGGDPYE
jgi:hypothetical protein